jgi:hypothetical protein
MEPILHDQVTDTGNSSLSWPVFVRDALFCGLVGAILAIVPHIASKAAFGTWEFHQDLDEVVYRLIAKPAMDGSWTMRDVFVQSDRDLPTTYSWMQFVPTSHAAIALGFDIVSLGQFWRLTGGFLTGISLFAAFASFRVPVSRPRLFVILATILALSDAGFVQGRVLLQNVLIAKDYVRLQPIKPHATNFAAYRVISPILSLPFTILAATLLSPEVLRRAPRRAILAALFTTLSISLYFFQWTALCVGAGACLAIFAAYDIVTKNDNRKSSALAIMALGLGVLLGSPQILYNARIFAAPELEPILERIGRGQVIPPGNPYVYVNLVNYWVWLKLSIGAIVIWRFRSRGIALFLAVGLGGYALANSAIVTRLEFENWHWMYVYGPFLAMPVYVGSVALMLRVFGPKLSIAAVALTCVSAVILRGMEVKLAPESMLVRKFAADIAPIRPLLATIPDDGQRCIAGFVPAQLAALSMPGGRLLYHFPYASQISLMPMEEVHERVALTYWLTGMSRETLSNMPDSEVTKVQLAEQTRPEWKPEVVRAAQLAIFDKLESSPAEVARLMATYAPEWLLLNKSEHVIPPVRGGSWKRVVSTELHELWNREAD